jgi:6-pyruvoyltetrahydropterin/6-carboxytetrahydropterin synthase
LKDAAETKQRDQQVPPEAFRKRVPAERATQSWGDMFQVSVEETFSAGHALRGYKGKCENPHGHNYRVRVTVEGPQVDATGLLVDFVQVKQVIREVMGRLDHQFMNDLQPFKTVNPSAENVAKYFYEEISKKLKELPPGARVTDVVLWETDTSRAQYRPGA